MNKSVLDAFCRAWGVLWRGVIFDGQDPFIMTSGRYGLLEISELMHGDWL